MNTDHADIFRYCLSIWIFFLIWLQLKEVCRDESFQRILWRIHIFLIWSWLLFQPSGLLRAHSSCYQLMVSIWWPDFGPGSHMLAIRYQRSYHTWHQGISVSTLLFDFFFKYGKCLCLGKCLNSNVPLIFRVKCWVSSERTRAAPTKLTFLGQNASLSTSALSSLRRSPSGSLFSFL